MPNPHPRRKREYVWHPIKTRRLAGWGRGQSTPFMRPGEMRLWCGRNLVRQISAKCALIVPLALLALKLLCTRFRPHHVLIWFRVPPRPRVRNKPMVQPFPLAGTPFLRYNKLVFATKCGYALRWAFGPFAKDSRPHGRLRGQISCAFKGAMKEDKLKEYNL